MRSRVFRSGSACPRAAIAGLYAPNRLASAVPVVGQPAGMMR